MFFRKCIYLWIAVFLLAQAADVLAAADVAAHAPVGVMGDHRHEKGEWMTSYRYMHMDMPKNYSGTKRISSSGVHDDFPVSPTDMTMEMHMLGIMYGLTDDVTAMVMVPFIQKDMSHVHRNGRRFRTHTEGVGDVKLSGLFSLEKFIDLKSHFNFGVSFPTGSIDETDDTLLGAGRNLPYPMQLGAGTVSLLPGFTIYEVGDRWSWGIQQASTIPLGTNDRKYQLGDQYELTGWMSYTWEEWISTSFRLKSSWWSDIRGADSRLNVNLVPTADPNRRGGKRVDAFLGVNLIGQSGVLHDHRLAIELGYPIHQDLDGPQLGVGLQTIVAWQKAF